MPAAAFLTSCSVTTPPAPLAETRAISTPSLRASARTAGTALTPPIATACSLTMRSLLSIAQRRCRHRRAASSRPRQLRRHRRKRRPCVRHRAPANRHCAPAAQAWPVRDGGRSIRLPRLRHLRVEFDVDQRRAGVDHVAGLAVQRDHLAGERRRHFDDGLGGLHRYQWCVEPDDSPSLTDTRRPLHRRGLRRGRGGGRF